MSTAMNEREIIDRKYLCDLAKEVGLTTLDLEALGENHHWEIVVEGNLLERMIETQRQFERLAVIGDEECRGFYIEVPRPTSEDWGNAEELIASGEYSSMDAYLSDWLAFNPIETRWFYVTSRKHGNNRSIHVTDRKFTHFVISNRSSYNEKEFDDVCCKENLTRFFDFLNLMIGVIVADSDGFNEYVANNLPYQQRTGRISRKNLVRIVPSLRIDVEDREMTVKALEDSIQGCSLSPIEIMTIRKFCKFYRIANEAYKVYHKKRGIGGRINKDSKRDLQKISDVAYYKYMKYVDVENLYNVDSQEDFIRFATDHYGELGLSRLNILASNVQHQGWKIVVSNSYSSNVGLAMEVAVSLYKADAPLHIYDAEKLLSILKEEDFVRLVPDSYHNYMGYQEEGTVYELPWEYECSDEKNSFLTLEQYHDIISHTEWESEKRVEPIS